MNVSWYNLVILRKFRIMDDFLIGIGKRIRAIRKEERMTISMLASSAGVSNGLISRIENGRTIPSLPVLLSLITSLNHDVSKFFEGVESKIGGKYICIRAAEQEIIEKEVEAVGFSYSKIFGKSINSLGFEAVVLTIQPNSKREMVTTDAWEFKYILSGHCIYNIDGEEVLLNEGDSIYFDGRLPHVPINKSESPCVMLVLYFYTSS